ncbi:MAG: phosphate regulon sensor histidine kinase PhoR [Betaproteobacteria bacterium]|nr:phosphate regulon sensor histidine kinase PhoR [Betaproteobacteria bacterium]
MSPFRDALVTVAGRLLVAALPFAVTGFFIWGAAGAWAAIALVLGVAFVYYAVKLGQLLRWLEAPDTAVPDGSGLWGDVLSRLYRLMRQERQAHQQLTDALARFQQAAEAVPDGAVMLDADNRIIWCNATGARDLSIHMAKDRGGLIANIVRQPAFVEALNMQNYREPFSLKGHGAPDQSLSVIIVPFGSDQKLVLARDVTQLEKLDTMRRDFIANVSHELRTPLTVLAGFVETLTRANDGANPVTNKALGHMEAQAARMQHLVDDLLALSRLEDSANPLVEQAINMPELVAALATEAEQLSNGKHQISMRSGDAWVSGNRDELRSALSNLVTNAIRYTPTGGHIDIAWELAGDAPVFRVKDSGEGIAAEHIPRLTERFYRVDRGRSRASGGTGLGLAIVKHVINRHQARLDIESIVGQGSTFSVVFPAARRLPAAAVAANG